jgi:hypothetical protein
MSFCFGVIGWTLLFWVTGKSFRASHFVGAVCYFVHDRYFVHDCRKVPNHFLESEKLGWESTPLSECRGNIFVCLKLERGKPRSQEENPEARRTLDLWSSEVNVFRKNAGQEFRIRDTKRSKKWLWDEELREQESQNRRQWLLCDCIGLMSPIDWTVLNL